MIIKEAFILSPNGNITYGVIAGPYVLHLETIDIMPIKTPEVLKFDDIIV